MTWNNHNYQFIKHLEIALIIGAGTLICSYLTVYSWMDEGLDLIETSLTSVITGLYMFFLTFIMNIWLLNSYRRSCIDQEIVPYKRINSVLLALGMTVVAMIFFDFGYFYLIDDSVSYSYAESLENMLRSAGKTNDRLSHFYTLPFLIQNLLVTIVFAIIANALSLIFIRKDGKLLKTEKEYV